MNGRHEKWRSWREGSDVMHSNIGALASSAAWRHTQSRGYGAVCHAYNNNVSARVLIWKLFVRQQRVCFHKLAHRICYIDVKLFSFVLWNHFDGAGPWRFYLCFVRYAVLTVVTAYLCLWWYPDCDAFNTGIWIIGSSVLEEHGKGNVAWESAASYSGYSKTLFCPEVGSSRFLRKLCRLYASHIRILRHT